jgi:hypothetical protein
MSDSLNATLAVAKQAYEELGRLVSLTDLEKCEFGSGPKRERIAYLLGRLSTAIGTVKRDLSSHVAEASESPVLRISAAHRDFCNDTLLPQAKVLQRAQLEIDGLGFAVDFLLDDSTAERPSPQTHSAISWGLERWNDMLEDGERFEWLERGFNIEAAQSLVEMPWFQPDEWLQNLRLLEPVLVDRPSHELRDHVRYRLTEIYRAFTFGLWMAAIALSRSLVEFSLKANAPGLGISTTYLGSGGRPEDKLLRQLGDDVATILPALAQPIETVRETGNRILHAKKRDVIAYPKVMRSEALECIRAARRVVEHLYSVEQPPAA